MESSLTAFIKGGSEVSIGHGSTITLDGATGSSDPDFSGTGTDTNLKFSWSCMSGKVNMNMNILNVNHFDSSSCPDALNYIYTHTAGTLEIDTSVLAIGSYTFRMVLEKDVRSSHNDQVVQVMSGHIPDGLRMR